MIDHNEVLDFAQRFGVPDEQIRRDHLINHTLAALSSKGSNQPGNLVFFGGTALCRTWLPDLRYYEDIDLLVDTLDQGDALRRSISLAQRHDLCFSGREAARQWIGQWARRASAALRRSQR